METPFSLVDLCARRSHLQPVVCLEVTPPRNEDGWCNLRSLVERTRPWANCLAMADVGPLRGAGAVAAAVRLHAETGVPVIAHMACTGRTGDDFFRDADTLYKGGISHLLVIRGDPECPGTPFVPVPGGFAHASEAIDFLVRRRAPLIIGAGCYPGGHPEDENPNQELRTMQRKARAGAQFFTSQAIFDHVAFRDHVLAAAKLGIAVPIIPCLLAVRDLAHLERVARRCQLAIPDDLRRVREGDPGSQILRQVIGTARAAWIQGAPGVHICTFNNADLTVQFLRGLFDLPAKPVAISA